MEQRAHQPRAIGDYITSQEIGAGSFAVVWKARHKITGHEVAIKEIGTEKLNKKLQESLLSEISILKKANHPNIIRLHAIVEAPDRIYLILEYCAGGDLAGYIHRHGKVGESAARNIMQQLGSGLQVLRKNNLIHRDLKPQNLLLSTNDHNAVLKIADFGFARSLQPQGMAETLCGSPLYMAPEILHCQKYDAKADLWSVGAILYQLVLGRPPFSGNNHVQLLQNITKNEVQFPHAAQLHPDCIDMCRKLLRRNPVERLSFEEFFNHPFMRPSSLRPFHKATHTDVDSLDSHQEDCFPFLIDEEPQGTIDIPVKQPPQTRITGVKLSNSPPNLFKEQRGIPDHEETGKVYHMAEAEACQDAEGSSSPRTVVDSMEYIERDYVVVKRFTSPEALSLTFSASPNDQHGSKGGSPHKNFTKSSSPVLHAPLSGGAGSRGSTPPGLSEGYHHPDSGDTLEAPSPHPATRISSLQCCARLVAELATDKFNSGHPLESLSVHLICLAIWKEALQVCHAWAAPATGPRGLGMPRDQEGAATCTQVEHEFSLAVDRGDGYAAHLRSMDGSVEMPDAVEIIFQAALTVGRAGAVEELMGNVANASVAYGKAVTFLYFLLVEGPCLQLNPPLALTLGDRQRLKRYADMINARLKTCTAQRDLPQAGRS
ncbi:serine/threonine-protein kinase ATG1c [Selaginella moellendorffii]|uniref:serine/threonine-protein kinase ATG1c n=1 Tax=Selaginella moellendorffii TaxID=88036 RepID=UPI000D1C74B2|nr:serine/threonine-protein kinase ATG1c [Selaginella moellendorffii]|eukprot:XP_024515761.1 serine/threonine-protein kinase ATG1c [Selaginella moellendorffii]